MDIKQLIYFNTLAKYEHYTKSAEELQISQPTLSRSISKLEHEIGAYLFEKQGRNVVLTKYGILFQKRVNNALIELEAGKKEIKDSINCNKGHVSLGFISAVGTYFIPRLISSFKAQRQYADISLSCSEGNTSDLLKSLKEEQYDIVICSKKNHELNLNFTPILAQHIMVLVPRGHPLSEKTGVVLNETASYPFILHTHTSGMRAITDYLFEKAKIAPVISCEVEEDRTIAGLVEVNLGIALVSDSPNIDNPNITKIPLIEPRCIRYLYMATVKNRCISPAARAFKSFMLKNQKI